MGVNIVIADDHGVLRGGLRAMLSAELELNVVGEAADGDEALRVVDKLQPDILLADISMPGPNGIELTRILSRSAPNTRVVILSMHEDDSLVRAAFDAGAWGYVPKRAAETELIRAVRVVAQGGKYGKPDDRHDIIRAATTVLGSRSVLERQDHELLRLIADGYANAEIARKLKLELTELERRRQDLYLNLGVRSRAELLRWMVNNPVL